MAKVKPAGSSKKTEELPPWRGALPCGFLILMGMLFIGALLYYSLKSTGPAQ